MKRANKQPCCMYALFIKRTAITTLHDENIRFRAIRSCPRVGVLSLLLLSLLMDGWLGNRRCPQQKRSGAPSPCRRTCYFSKDYVRKGSF